MKTVNRRLRHAYMLATSVSLGGVALFATKEVGGMNFMTHDIM
jgi:hypothetical protein